MLLADSGGPLAQHATPGSFPARCGRAGLATGPNWSSRVVYQLIGKLRAISGPGHHHHHHHDGDDLALKSPGASEEAMRAHERPGMGQEPDQGVRSDSGSPLELKVS